MADLAGLSVSSTAFVIREWLDFPRRHACNFIVVIQPVPPVARHRFNAVRQRSTPKRYAKAVRQSGTWATRYRGNSVQRQVSPTSTLACFRVEEGPCTNYN